MEEKKARELAWFGYKLRHNICKYIGLGIMILGPLIMIARYFQGVNIEDVLLTSLLFIVFGFCLWFTSRKFLPTKKK
ncbi:TPA: hypothetical protein HA278_05655 [Candidatus Woesearchaeota archaeon]|nr:hypothetical protein [archaeon]HIJ11515.1 hypothetical protein [Candidatus Woesearchaeota archaeon]